MTACVSTHRAVSRIVPEYVWVDDLVRTNQRWFNECFTPAPRMVLPVARAAAAIDAPDPPPLEHQRHNAHGAPSTTIDMFAMLRIHFPSEFGDQPLAAADDAELTKMVELHIMRRARGRLNRQRLIAHTARLWVEQTDASWLDTHARPRDDPALSTLLCDGAFSLAMKLVCGLPVNTGGDAPCRLCRRAPSANEPSTRWLDDRFGAHLMLCKGLGFVIGVHDQCTRLYAAEARLGGLETRLEPRYDATGARRAGRRGDVRFDPDPSDPNRGLFADTVCPSLSAHANARAIMSDGRGAAAAAHEQRKRNELPEQIANGPDGFCPVGIETTPGGGAVGPSGLKLARALEERRRANRGGAPIDWTKEAPKLIVRLQLACERARYHAWLARRQRTTNELAAVDLAIIAAARADLGAADACERALAWLPVPRNPRGVAKLLLPPQSPAPPQTAFLRGFKLLQAGIRTRATIRANAKTRHASRVRATRLAAVSLRTFLAARRTRERAIMLAAARASASPMWGAISAIGRPPGEPPC